MNSINLRVAGFKSLPRLRPGVDVGEDILLGYLKDSRKLFLSQKKNAKFTDFCRGSKTKNELPQVGFFSITPD